MLTVERLSTLVQLEAIAPEWQALWDRVGWTTPFQSPAWLIPWWRHFGNGDLNSLAVRSAGRLVGVAPLFRGPTGALVPLGAGITDYLDVLIEGDWVRPVCAAMRAAHAEEGPGTRWQFHDVPPQAMLLRAGPAGRDGGIQPGECCPVLDLPARGEPPDRAVPRSMLQKLAYYRRLASRHGAVRVEAARPDNFALLYEALLRLHAARWAARGGAGVLNDKRLQRFHQEAAAGLLAIGALRLYALFIEVDAVAVFYGMHAKGTTYYYLGGFDPAFNRLSPGTLIVGHAIENAVGDGARAFNFLRGREAYKYRWGARDRQSCICTIWCHPAREPARDDTLSAPA